MARCETTQASGIWSLSTQPYPPPVAAPASPGNLGMMEARESNFPLKIQSLECIN